MGGDIKVNLREIGWGGIDWVDVAQDRDHSNEIPSPIKH
jgi:hypothetical protein